MFGLRRINRDSIQEKLKSIVGNLGVFCKWSLIAILVGVAAGAFSTAFGHCINFVTTFRTNHLWTIFFLPFAGMLIIYLYKVCDYEKNKGTDQVFLTVHAEKKDIPFRMAPLIFISTVLTHLCGGSAGREGAALQMGGSIGSTIGRIIHLDEKDRIVLVMCGMSAAFSALFGTPMAATIFAMEVESVGIMYYAALLPGALSAIIASRFAVNMGINPESFLIQEVPGVYRTEQSESRYSCHSVCLSECLFLCHAAYGQQISQGIFPESVCQNRCCGHFCHRSQSSAAYHRLYGSRHRCNRKGSRGRSKTGGLSSENDTYSGNIGCRI